MVVAKEFTGENRIMILAVMVVPWLGWQVLSMGRGVTAIKIEGNLRILQGAKIVSSRYHRALYTITTVVM